MSEFNAGRVRKLDAKTGIISTVVGLGGSSGIGDNGPAKEARLRNPTGIAVDFAGNLFIADQGNRRIRKVDAATQIITTVAGTGNPNVQYGGVGDNGPATEAQLMYPWDIVLDARGHMYVTDGDRIRRIDAVTGIITTVAGGHDGHAPDSPRRAILARDVHPHGAGSDCG